METPVQITFRDMPHSDAIEQTIRDYSSKLERFYDGIIRCRVVIEAPHRHHRKGVIYHVRIDLTVPGAELVVNREPQEHHAHEDLHVALRDAFLAATRQLEEFARRRRHQVKTHEEPPHGRIDRLFPDRGYGFITTADGRSIYFHKNSVANGGFDSLAVGTEVSFVADEVEGENGPQATTVRARV